MLRHLDETERYLMERSRQHSTSVLHAAIRDIEDDAVLCTFISLRYERFLNLVPFAHMRLGSYIRKHSHEFVFIRMIRENCWLVR